MGADINGILEYFKSAKAGFWDYFAVVFLFLILLLVIVLAWREYRRMRRARKLVKHRFGGKPRAGTRRDSVRIPIRFPVQLRLVGSDEVQEGEVLDLSSGGLRLILYRPTEPVARDQRYVVASQTPPIRDFENPILEVVNVSRGPRTDTPVLHGRWLNLDENVAKTLNKQIQQRLLGKN